MGADRRRGLAGPVSGQHSDPPELSRWAVLGLGLFVVLVTVAAAAAVWFAFMGLVSWMLQW